MKGREKGGIEEEGDVMAKQNKMGVVRATNQAKQSKEKRRWLWSCVVM